MTLGQWFKHERLKNGLTLLDMEERSQISKSTISRIERDEVAKLKTINNLARALNLSLGDYYPPARTQKK